MKNKEITLQEKIKEFINELPELDRDEINRALEESEWQETNLKGYAKSYLTGLENALKSILNLLIDFNIDPELTEYPKLAYRKKINLNDITDKGMRQIMHENIEDILKEFCMDNGIKFPQYWWWVDSIEIQIPEEQK